ALCEMSGDGVAIGFGDRLLRLHGRPVGGAVAPPLTVQVDGMAVACIRFARNGRTKAAEVVRRLPQGGLSVFLASERVSATQVGIDRYCGNISTGDKIQFLRSLRRQSVAAAYIATVWRMLRGVGGASVDRLRRDRHCGGCRARPGDPGYCLACPSITPVP